MSEQQKVFEALLKDSRYFLDVIDTHRRGAARVMSAAMLAIIEAEPAMKDRLIKKLRDAECDTGSPSIDTETRRLTRAIIDSIRQPPDLRLVEYGQMPSQCRHLTPHKGQTFV